MSHDIAYKSSLTKYRGYGLRRLLVDNPARADVFA